MPTTDFNFQFFLLVCVQVQQLGTNIDKILFLGNEA